MLQMNQLCEPELKKIVRLYFEVGRLPKNLKQHRLMFAMADARLLANPASWGRVADPSPN